MTTAADLVPAQGLPSPGQFVTVRQRRYVVIADDVGLGKTIEAGLVVEELLLRHRACTVIVVCLAGLQLQWRDQMRDKFGLEMRIVDSASLRELRRLRPRTRRGRAR